MLLWEKKIPEYFTERKNVVSFILFTAVFALVFINIYAPFGVDRWLNVTDFQLFLYSSIVILIGMLVIVISRLLMYLITRKKSIRYGEYGLWIFGEIFSMALVYAIIQRFFLHVNRDFMLILKNSLRITAFIILLPYVISWLYISFRDKYKTLERITRNKPALNNKFAEENRQSGGILSMIPFRDEKGVMKFSIKKEDLLYLEAADNYVIIHYLDHNRQSRYIIRNTLKRIEQEFQGSGLVRCHRSFIVNLDNVKVIRKEKDGLIIGFEAPTNITVPISKTYLDTLIRKLSLAAQPDESENEMPYLQDKDSF
jgi:DNA-binding LytR/AlgR family response regulator